MRALTICAVIALLLATANFISYETCYDVAKEYGFDTYVSAIDMSGLKWELEDAYVVSTVFIPTNEAFSEAAEKLGLTIEDLVMDISKLKKILEYHIVVDGAFFASNLTYNMSLGTRAGEFLTIDLRAGFVSVNTSCSGGLIVSVEESNGMQAGEDVCHIIDAVLLECPSGVAEDNLIGQASEVGRFRHLLQDGGEQNLRLSSDSCDPNYDDCSVVFEEQCIDVIPPGSEITCEQYVADGICSILGEEYCQLSCNKCCTDIVIPGVDSCDDVVATGLCDAASIAGIYCLESCGACPIGSGSEPSIGSSPDSYDSNPSDWDPVFVDVSSPSDQTTFEPPAPSYIDDDCSQPGALKCDLDALISFKNTISQGGDLFSSWTGEDPCDWLYVTCEDIDSSHKRVSTVDMDFLDTGNENKISGMLVPEFSKLRYAEEILISNQEDITGTLPVEYSVLDQLTTFRIWRTSISGSFPVEYSSWTKLEYFTCSFNSMSGTIPTQWSSWEQLQYFRIGANTYLSGTLPAQLSTWVDILAFYISSNTFLGQLPSQYSVMHKIEDFLIFKNQLSGSLPEQYSTMSNVLEFAVDRNAFTGTLPAQYSTMQKVQKLLVWQNDLSGSLPPQYSTMDNVDMFGVSRNNLSGTLPAQYSTMTKIENFTSFGNSITSTLPSEWSTFPDSADIDL